MADYNGTSGDDIYTGTNEYDRIYGNDGDDVLSGGGGYDNIYGGSGNDILSLYGGLGWMDGGDGDDRLEGGNGIDSLNGGDGNDMLSGGGGTDYIRSGSGIDTINGGSGADLIWAKWGDNVDGGEGSDQLDLDLSAMPESLSADLGSLITGDSFTIGGTTFVGIEALKNLKLTVFDDVVTLDQNSLNSNTFSIDGHSGADHLTGSPSRDSISGGDGDDIIFGGGGRDSLRGGKGNDTISGGEGDDYIEIDGSDTVDGGDGDDFFYLDHSAATEGVIIDLRAVWTGGTGYVAGGTVVNVERVLGLISSDFADTVFTGDITSANRFEFRGGDDVATGGSLKDWFDGGNGNDTLRGSGGVDRLYGNEGNDTLDGGVGADTLVGGRGDDLYFIDNAGDIVTEFAGEGIDEVRATTAAFTLVAEIENLTTVGTRAFTGTGNALANRITGGVAADVLRGGGGEDTLIGNEGNDTLDGGAGIDAMRGGAGNDFYWVDDAADVVIELSREGVDVVRASVATFTLGSHIESLAYVGAGAFAGRGNVLANHITGGAAADTLIGLIGNDTLIGGAGDDMLFGGVGADTMRGGSGNDIYYVDDANDRVIEQAGEGMDVIRAVAASVTMTAGIETLVFNGTGTFTGIGNAEANTIVGGAAPDVLTGGEGNDRLDGQAGVDRLFGGTGDDVYVVDDPLDRVFEVAGAGYDTIEAAIGWQLGDAFEALVLTGTASVNGDGNALDNALTGNAAANVLTGGDGNDRLDGQGGADRLIGGAGNDSYVIDDAGDVIVELDAAGVDTVETARSYTLGTTLDALVLTGTAAVDGVGNDTNNAITGNAAANVLRGFAGADVLSSGDGNDTLRGGPGADFLDGGAGIDILTGGTERDNLTGGAGADRFAFFAGDTSASRALADRILDFRHAEGDLILLSGIDADTAATDDQAFTFIGTAAFGAVAGELRVQTTNAFTYVEGDVNGDGVADFSIRLEGTVALVAGDFVL